MSNQSKKKIGSEIKKMIDTEIGQELSDLKVQLSHIQCTFNQQPQSISSQMRQQRIVMQQIQQFSDITQNQLLQTGQQLQQSIQQTIQTLNQCYQIIQTTQSINQINQVIDQAKSQFCQTNQQQQNS